MKKCSNYPLFLQKYVMSFKDDTQNVLKKEMMCRPPYLFLHENAKLLRKMSRWKKWAPILPKVFLCREWKFISRWTPFPGGNESFSHSLLIKIVFTPLVWFFKGAHIYSFFEVEQFSLTVPSSFFIYARASKKANWMSTISRRNGERAPLN